jgi:hypothetical protein
VLQEQESQLPAQQLQVQGAMVEGGSWLDALCHEAFEQSVCDDTDLRTCIVLMKKKRETPSQVRSRGYLYVFSHGNGTCSFSHSSATSAGLMSMPDHSFDSTSTNPASDE